MDRRVSHQLRKRWQTDRPNPNLIESDFYSTLVFRPSNYVGNAFKIRLNSCSFAIGRTCGLPLLVVFLSAQL